jgi:hypothetical protein
MDSRTILGQFAEINDRNSGIAKFISGTGIFEYEEEYGKDLAHFTDEDLFDYFIVKKKYFRLIHISKLVTEFGAFYNYCLEKGYIHLNPFQNSMLFRQDYLIEKIASLGNVQLYSKEYVINSCRKTEDNSPYYLSIMLSLYEGVQDVKTLGFIKYDDVNFKDKVIISNGVQLPISDELISAINDMYQMQFFVVNDKKGLYSSFYDDNGYLIRQTLQAGATVASTNKTARIKALSTKITNVGLNDTFICDSSILLRLSSELGVDRLIQILDYESGKRTGRDDTGILSRYFEQWGVTKSVKNFIFNYKVYVPLLRNNIIM